MKNEVIEIISKVTEIPTKKISLESNLIKDLELESLDLVSLVAEFEEKYNIVVDDKDIKNLQTVNDIVEYLEKNV